MKLFAIAPANVAVEYYEDLTTFKGTFNHSSIYRGDPTLEIDEAWERVSTGGEHCLDDCKIPF